MVVVDEQAQSTPVCYCRRQVRHAMAVHATHSAYPAQQDRRRVRGTRRVAIAGRVTVAEEALQRSVNARGQRCTSSGVDTCTGNGGVVVIDIRGKHRTRCSACGAHVCDLLSQFGMWDE